MTPWTGTRSRHARARAVRVRSQSAPGTRLGTARAAQDLLTSLVAALEPVMDHADPLDAELVISHALALIAPDGTGAPTWEQALDAAAHRATPTDTAVLGLVAAHAGPAALRKRARELAATALTEGAVPPAWWEGLTPVTLGRCWAMSDVFGDQTNVVMEFRRGRAVHAVVFLVDAAGPQPSVRDMFLTDNPAATVAQMREYCATTDGLMRCGAVEPGPWLQDIALALGRPTMGPDSDSFAAAWPLVLSRLADVGYPVRTSVPGLAGAVGQGSDTSLPPVPDAGTWVERFVAAGQPGGLCERHAPWARDGARLLFDTCVAVLGEAPDHVSPVSLDLVVPLLARAGQWSAALTSGAEGPGSGDVAHDAGLQFGGCAQALVGSSPGATGSGVHGPSAGGASGTDVDVSPAALGCVVRAWVTWATGLEQYDPVACGVLADVEREVLAAVGTTPCQGDMSPAQPGQAAQPGDGSPATAPGKLRRTSLTRKPRSAA